MLIPSETCLPVYDFVKEWKRMGKGRCYVTSYSYVLLYKLHASWPLGQTRPTLIIQPSRH